MIATSQNDSVIAQGPRLDQVKNLELTRHKGSSASPRELCHNIRENVSHEGLWQRLRAAAKVCPSQWETLCASLNCLGDNNSCQVLILTARMFKA